MLGYNFKDDIKASNFNLKYFWEKILSPSSAWLRYPLAFVASHLWPGCGARQSVDCWRTIILFQIILSVSWALQKSQLFPLKQLITAGDRILGLEAPLLWYICQFHRLGRNQKNAVVSYSVCRLRNNYLLAECGASTLFFVSCWNVVFQESAFRGRVCAAHQHLWSTVRGVGAAQK